MKLWIASYPRSGNTFLRLLLNQCFGIKSTSIYGSEDAEMHKRPWLMCRIGYAGPIQDAGNANIASKEWIAVKTHDAPFDDGAAIYIVRDGRAAIISYIHMLADYLGHVVEFRDVVDGNVWPGSWSEHFTVWDPENRPRTLLLRYEELKSEVGLACHKISEFLGTAQKREFVDDFDCLKAFEPTLFRSGDNEKNIQELIFNRAIFDARHSSLMRRLGYY